MVSPSHSVLDLFGFTSVYLQQPGCFILCPKPPVSNDVVMTFLMLATYSSLLCRYLATHAVKSVQSPIERVNANPLRYLGASTVGKVNSGVHAVVDWAIVLAMVKMNARSAALCFSISFIQP